MDAVVAQHVVEETRGCRLARARRAGDKHHAQAFLTKAARDLGGDAFQAAAVLHLVLGNEVRREAMGNRLVEQGNTIFALRLQTPDVTAKFL